MIKINNKLNLNQVFSGHETFPLRYGWLKKGIDAVIEAEKNGLDAKDVFSEDDAISKFGVGKNMVSSIRHWCNVLGLLEDNYVTELGKGIFGQEGLDPWIEHPLTLWILHYNLATNRQLGTYYWYFNINNSINLDRKAFLSEVLEYCKREGLKAPAQTTLKRDIECFLRLYMPKLNSINDDSIESPLTELDLIIPLHKNGFFASNRGKKSSLPVEFFWLATFLFWKNNYVNQRTLSLSSITYQQASPGRVFLLDENSIMDFIYNSINLFSQHLDWSETAGLKQLEIKAGVELDSLINTCTSLLKRVY